MKKWIMFTPLLTVGFCVAFSLLIPTIIGWRIGIKAQHELLYPLIGLGVGTIIMVCGVYRILRPFLQQAQGDEEDKKQVPQPMRTFLNLAFPRKKRDKK